MLLRSRCSLIGSLHSRDSLVPQMVPKSNRWALNQSPPIAQTCRMRSRNYLLANFALAMTFRLPVRHSHARNSARGGPKEAKGTERERNHTLLSAAIQRLQWKLRPRDFAVHAAHNRGRGERRRSWLFAPPDANLCETLWQ